MVVLLSPGRSLPTGSVERGRNASRLKVRGNDAPRACQWRARTAVRSCYQSTARIRPRWRNGKRRGLKIPSRKACGFESRPGDRLSPGGSLDALDERAQLLEP